MKEKILQYLETTLSAESKLGASDEVIKTLLSVKYFIEKEFPQPEHFKSIEEILNELAKEHENKYASFPAFVENELSLEVFDLVCNGALLYAKQYQRQVELPSDAIAFAEWFLQYEHGSTDILGNKKWRLRDGGVYSKCYTALELYAKFQQQLTKK